MSTKLVSTKARVGARKKVRAILDSYATDGVEFRLTDDRRGWFLEAAFEEDDLGAWGFAAAVHHDQLPDKEAYADEGAWMEAWDGVLVEKGQEGFLVLLRELAPHLKTPLLILSASWGGAEGGARAWIVQPGAKEPVTLRL
jgi:hypothetical protein